MDGIRPKVREFSFFTSISKISYNGSKLNFPFNFVMVNDDVT